MTPTNSNQIISNIFANNFLKEADASALVKQYDISDGLRAANAITRLSTLPQVQLGFNISSIPPQGILINAPGTYQFTNDIVWTPGGDGIAISIQSTGVTLDFKTFCLSAVVSDNTKTVKGIDISNYDTVSIQNGSVKNMSYYSISASTGANLSIQNMVIDGLSYLNTVVPNTTPCGIFVDSSLGIAIEGCTVQNINVTSSSCAGIQIIKSIAGKVSNCTLNNIVNNDGAVQGYSCLFSADINTSNCTASNFQSHYQGLTQTTGHTVLGFIPILCYNLSYETCTATNITGCCDDCHAMSVFINAKVSVTNFTAKNVTDGVTPKNTGAKATGLEVYGNNITITNCLVENIIAIVPQDLQSAGFSAWGNSISFTGCTATNVQVTDANKVPSTQYGYGTGFGWAPDPRPIFDSQTANDVTYTNCVSNNCQLGFDTWYHTNSVWKGVTAPGCSEFILVQAPLTPRTLSMDKCSELPSGYPSKITLYNLASNNQYPELKP